MKKLLAKFLTKKYIIGTITVIVLAAVGAAIFGSGDNGREVVTVERKSIVQEVSVTGKTKAENEVELGFDTSGRVARAYAKVGDRVGAGQIVAELDTSEVLANLAKERAVLAEEEEKLGEEGERIESSIREAYAAADNAVRNKADQFFKTPVTNPSFEVKFSDGNFVHYFAVPSEKAIELNSGRKSIELQLTKWQTELVQLDASNAKNFSPVAIERMNAVSDFLNKVASAINSFTPAEFAYESTVAGYKTSIDSARTGVAAARGGIINASSAGTARVNQIKSAILALESSLRKSRIVAPFSGVVTVQEAKVGESVTAGSPLVTLISDQNIFVEANVSEINVGKIQTGNGVEIEFDAYPDEVFDGEIVFIDPAETIVDKVVNYKIKITLSETKFPSGQLKSGLTANVKIVASQKENVLTVPQYAISKEGSASFVNKLTEDEIVKTEIETGLTGSDGLIEVIGGLAEGDQILVSSN